MISALLAVTLLGGNQGTGQVTLAPVREPAEYAINPLTTLITKDYTCEDGKRTLAIRYTRNLAFDVVKATYNGKSASDSALGQLRAAMSTFDYIEDVIPQCGRGARDQIMIVGSSRTRRVLKMVFWDGRAFETGYETEVSSKR